MCKCVFFYYLIFYLCWFYFKLSEVLCSWLLQSNGRCGGGVSLNTLEDPFLVYLAIFMYGLPSVLGVSGHYICHWAARVMFLNCLNQLIGTFVSTHTNSPGTAKKGPFEAWLSTSPRIINRLIGLSCRLELTLECNNMFFNKKPIHVVSSHLIILVI